MNAQQARKMIEEGKTVLGIEFGSTRIKAVLIDLQKQPIASGSYEWENQLKEGIWTYSLNEIWHGLQASYQKLSRQVLEEFNVEIKKLTAIGFSAMMHGYLPFDSNNQLLVPFRTWRNSITEQAEKELTALFNYNVPQRWSVAHLYQAILNEEKHVKEISYFTTLAGYVHWQLTGEKVLGIGDASGMFPIDSKTKNYNQSMLESFQQLVKAYQLPWQLEAILPQTLVAGESAGFLSEKGAKLIDPSGSLEAGIPLCPPEGDAGTGMVATNSIAKRTGNISAGTSVFAMIVLEKELKKVHPELDLVTTPMGELVAMVHANNCTSDLNAWVRLFKEFAELFEMNINDSELYERLFQQAEKGDADCGGLLSYGYLSGENITQVAEGRPLFIRKPDSSFTLANFMRTHLFSAFGALEIGMNILLEDEQVQIDRIFGHGGIFKTKEVAQKILARAIKTPVSVLETAGEGGAWGAALLADYLSYAAKNISLEEYLNTEVFADNKGSVCVPDNIEIAEFQRFAKRYKLGLPIEQRAAAYLP